VFGFTETKLGILPAVISPYVLPKIGPSAARELFLTGMRFDAARAKEIGLVHAVVDAHALDDAVTRYVREILSAAPTGVAAAKALIPRVWGHAPADAMAITAEAIAAQRVSPEGQAGLQAFLKKQKPDWVLPSRDRARAHRQPGRDRRCASFGRAASWASRRSLSTRTPMSGRRT
jgi:methylglutaconyl-CoA hydratase